MLFPVKTPALRQKLLLSTIQAYFEGKKELFKGLAIEQLETEWQPHVVLTLSLAKYNSSIEGSLEEILNNQFLIWEQQYDVKIQSTNLASRFENIITGCVSCIRQAGGDSCGRIRSSSY